MSVVHGTFVDNVVPGRLTLMDAKAAYGYFLKFTESASPSRESSAAFPALSNFDYIMEVIWMKTGISMLATAARLSGVVRKNFGAGSTATVTYKTSETNTRCLVLFVLC